MEEEHACSVTGQAAEDEVVQRAAGEATEPVPVVVAGLAKVADHLTRTYGEREIAVAKGQRHHRERLREPEIAQGSLQVVSPSRRTGTIQCDKDIASDYAKEDVGSQPSEIRPAVDQLAAVGCTSHRKIEPQHCSPL